MRKMSKVKTGTPQTNGAASYALVERAVEWLMAQALNDTDLKEIARGGCERLHAAGVTLVGIDSYNIDDTTDGQRPVHTILLGADIPIVEHLCHLEKLPDHGFAFYAVPVKIQGFGTFPVRAFGVVQT